MIVIKLGINMTNNQSVKHFITGTELTTSELFTVLERAARLKDERQKGMHANILFRKQLGLIFDKPSLRTRFSFTVGMTELGGQTIESISSERKHEEPEDLIRVLQGYCHLVAIRTHDDSILQKMQGVSAIPIINGLSNLHHPCQILADLLTLQEQFKNLSGLTITYIGDGNNILHSLLLLAPQFGIHLNYCCPQQCGPDPTILQLSQTRIGEGKITAFVDPIDAVKNSDAIYTDVWTSMGCTEKDEALFTNYQVNETLMNQAKPTAVFMHCLPMLRGKEVSWELPDSHQSVIFQQSENRLHVQKSLLLNLLNY